MPTYDYECDACGHTFELFQSISRRSRRSAPSARSSSSAACSAPARRSSSKARASTRPTTAAIRTRKPPKMTSRQVSRKAIPKRNEVGIKDRFEVGDRIERHEKTVGHRQKHEEETAQKGLAEQHSFEVFEANALPIQQTLPGFSDPRQESRVVLQSVIEPIVFGSNSSLALRLAFRVA